METELPSQAVESKNTNVSDPQISSGTVLIVDDDQESLGLLADLLSVNGYQVFTATNGNDAINIFEKKRPDLVITDIRMPQTDGLEVLSRARAIDETVAVILVTGYADLENAVGALQRGALDFLLKPIKTEILLNAALKGIELGRLKRLEKEYRRMLEEQVKERTRELAKTNDFLRGIIESSRGIAIVLTDLERTIIFWNSGAENIYGYKSEEIIGSDILNLFEEPGHAVKMLNDANLMMKNGLSVVQQTTKQVSKDGRILSIFLTMSHMLDGAGHIRGMLSLGQDVTEQVKLNKDLIESFGAIRRLQGAFIFALAKLAESRDEETAFHLKRIQAYCRVMCERLMTRVSYAQLMTETFIENLLQGSILHDIGKVGLPDAILFTSEKFAPEEFEIMKLHTIKGGEALEEAVQEAGEKQGYLAVGKDVAFYHHEHWNGSGYPFGIKEEQIPLAARIVAFADVYDALTTARRYKEAFSHEEACNEIIKAKGRQFDPDLVDVFIEVRDEFRKIRDDFSPGDPSREH